MNVAGMRYSSESIENTATNMSIQISVDRLMYVNTAGLTVIDYAWVARERARDHVTNER